jgi:hypothetical protein
MKERLEIMKNRIEKTERGYILTTYDGQEFVCSRWFEKKVEKWHVVVPKEGREICGRTYIRESNFDNSDVYEFETKTEHRSGLAGGGWRSKMTDEERKLVEECESTIERIKSECMAREVEKVDPNSEEGLMAQIEKLQKKLAQKRGEV